MVLALALLVVGGMALVNALTSSSSDSGPPGSALSVTPDSAEPKAGTSDPPGATRSAATTGSESTPLVIRVTGAPTQVLVRGTVSQEVFHQGVLNTNEVRQYDQVPLAVVANNGGSLQVAIYGEVQEPKPAGVRAEWIIPKR